MKLKDTICCGDNLVWMKKMPDEFVDLCYIDPPFFSNKNYEVIFNDGEEIRSFEDRWRGGIEHYIEWMRERVFEMHRILKDGGSFYLHCDWHASHHLRIMLDEIFDRRAFQNEIIWFYRGGGVSKKRFARRHDTIFFYAKRGAVKTFNGDEVRTPYSAESLERLKYVARSFRKTGTYDTYRADPRGKWPDDVWAIQPLMPANKLRLGYPTQKPRALLNKIIMASSNRGDLVFDPFCGCGTTLVVAEMVGRKWLGIDVSPTACRLMKRELSKVTRKRIEIVGVKYKVEELKSFAPFEFQNWVIGSLGGTVSEKKVKDMGIDGYTFMERNPVQVKQSEHVGRVTVDKFETALRRAKKEKGIIIGFSFTKDAHEEVARVKRTNHLEITLMTVEEVRSQLQSATAGSLLL